MQGKEAREYLVILRDKIHEILGAIKGLSFKENVILPPIARINNDRLIIGNEEVEKATYKSLLVEAKLGGKVTVSDSGSQYDLEKVMGFIMTEKQQEKEGVNVTNHNHGDTYIATQSYGNKNKVSGKMVMNLSEGNKQDIAELQESLTALMSHVEKHDADFAIKASAHAELQEINQHLANLENATPETKTKLVELLTNVKDGSLGAIKLAKNIKESSETVTWLMEKAAIVSAFLAAIPV